MACLAVAVFASPASATYLHSERTESAFGPDGTDEFSVENSFYDGNITDMVIDVQRRRLYVLQYRNPQNGGQGHFYPGAARGIYGYDISDPSSPKPLGGRFPLAITENYNGYLHLAVDEGTGNIYMLEKAEECYCEPGGTLVSWNTEGKLRDGYPVHLDKWGPIDFDSEGYLWVWREQNASAPDEKVKKYTPEGTFVGELTPTVTTIGAPHDISFNRNTGDMWLQYSEGIVKYTKDSGFTYHEAPIPTRWNDESGFEVDSEHGVVYSAIVSYNGGGIEALNEQSGKVEDRFGLGGIFEYNTNCGGEPCPPDAPEAVVRAMAYDDLTGDVYVVNDGHASGRLEEEEQAKGGRIEVFPGIGAANAHTNPPAEVGKTDAVLSGNVGPGEGPPVTDCRFEYVDDYSFNHVRVVSLNGAPGGRFRFNESQKWLPYNATAFEVEHAWPEESWVPTAIVTGPPGGPWRIEMPKFEYDYMTIDRFVSIRSNELKPYSTGTRISVGWDASTTPCEPSATPGSPLASPTDVEAAISGLAAKTTYHYRVVASSAPGTVWGGVETFTTTPSKVSTGDATEVKQQSATLNGTVDPEGLATTYYFEYGRTPAYGSTTSTPPGSDLGTTTPGDHAVSAPITGLEPGKTYHYRIVAVNSNGTSKGVDRVFVASPAVKDVETLPATEVHRGDAMLHGSLDPNGIETHYYFEYGTSLRYGSTTSAPPGPAVADSSPGDQEVSFQLTGLRAGTTYHYRLVASNSTYGTSVGQDRVFTTPAAVNSVSTDPATEIETENATLNGKLDPDGIPTTFYFEYGKSTSYGQTAPAPPGVPVDDSSPGVKSVQYVLEGLEPGTTYHYRIVAANDTGETRGGDQVFTTKEGPAIEGVRSDHVTADSAQLLGRIDPNGYATEWYFEYGLTPEYGSIAPVSGGSLPASKESTEVSVDLSNLQNLTYHFRLVAKSEWGTVKSEDQTFEFAPPSCPNSAQRQQTGSNYLPDCRAYELVTPSRAGGAAMYPPAPYTQMDGNHVGFSALLTAIPGTNPPNAGTGQGHSDFYVASRTDNGWKTHYVGVKGDETVESHEVNWKLDWEGSSGFAADEKLEHFLAWERRFPCCGDNGSYVAFLYDAAGNFQGRLPTNAAEIPGAIEKSALTENGFRGDGILSGDARKYIFSSTKVAFAPGGLTATPGSAYINDIETGDIEKISFDEQGNDLKQDPLATGFNLGQEFIKFVWASYDGSHVLMSLTAPGEGNCVYYCPQLNENLHLYMYVKGHGTYDISTDYTGVDRGVHYTGVASNGSEIFFESPDQMTSDDTDQSVDVFRWSEATNELERISTGVGGTGNGDDCSGSWTTRCGAEVVPVGHECVRTGQYERRPCGDNPVAKDTGEIYFYSPEQLDEGAKGRAGSRNLYVWRNGRPRYVTTVDGGRPLQRINVAFDGSWMSFLTKSRVTAYDNAEHSEMYRYDVENRSLVCASCRPDGEPPTFDAKASINGFFMSNDGRTFFSTEEALVNRDADGVSDTYEYVAGRAQLISNGAESGNGSDFAPIGLLGVTANGTDVFFSTYQTLVGQDENGSFWKIYDARTNGGFPFEKPPAPCAAADECHGPGNPAPEPPRIGSGAQLGNTGNYSPKKHKRHKKRRHRRHKKGAPHAKPRNNAKKGATR